MLDDHMLTLVAALFALAGCPSSGGEERLKAIRAAMEKLRPLHSRMGKPQPGDWLSVHPEPGQTFAQYVASRPVGPTARRRVIYIQPIGDFSASQRKVVALAAEFAGLYYCLPVKVCEEMPLSTIPDRARRVHPSWGVKQVLTTYVLDEVLKPRLPADAVAYLAFTTSDLWPGPGWNFVFGQASLRDRVGVWSIYRNGDPEGGPQAFRLCLLRTMKTAVHELGHMFSMYHCTAYDCCMNGSNHRAEADRRPLALCPECVAKVWWIIGCDPAERYRKLAAFCKKCGLTHEATFYEKSLKAISGG